MAAFRPRTRFAAPLVITFAAGCPAKKDEPQPLPGNPPAYTRTWSVQMQNMKCFATEHAPGNPPAPQSIDCPPGMTGSIAMTVAEKPNKACVTVPKGLPTPCPLPYGQQAVQKLQVVWMVEKRGPDCHAEELSNCPPGADCNPPKPRHFPCPPGVTEDKPLVLAELPDATCARVPEGCTDTGCATEKVDCLPADAKPTTE